jgi:hypothetical protein
MSQNFICDYKEIKKVNMEETFLKKCKEMNHLFQQVDFDNASIKNMSSLELEQLLKDNHIDYKYLTKDNMKKYKKIINQIHELFYEENQTYPNEWRKGCYARDLPDGDIYIKWRKINSHETECEIISMIGQEEKTFNCPEVGLFGEKQILKNQQFQRLSRKLSNALEKNI